MATGEDVPAALVADLLAALRAAPLERLQIETSLGGPYVLDRFRELCELVLVIVGRVTAARERVS